MVDRMPTYAEMRKEIEEYLEPSLGSALPGFALDLSDCPTPAFWTALAKAQAAGETIGKDEKNTQRGYKYASAENVTRGCRRPLNDHGFALISTWTAERVEVQPGGDIGNQFVAATVTEHFVLGSEHGVLKGQAVMDAIGSKARPTDNAVAATVTYMHGFVQLHLMNLDRAEEGQHAVDSREETDDFRPPQRRQAEQPKADPLRIEVRDMTKAIARRDPIFSAQDLAAAVQDIRKAANVPKAGHLSVPQLETLKEWLETRAATLDQDEGAEKPADYEAGDGFELEHPDEDPT